MTLLLVTADYRILVDASGTPVWLPLEAVEEERYLEALMYAPHAPTEPSFPYVAVRATIDEQHYWAAQAGVRWETIRSHLNAPYLAEAVAKLRFREEFRYHPTTGKPLRHGGGSAHSNGARPLFPRIDPAVIGLVELAGQDKILLGKNRLRPDYFSLIAGYVGPGETLEDAWAREVLEETGRRIEEIQYWGSQPWPSSGSLMIAFRAVTSDEEASQATDGELAEILWATREDLASLPLAAPGSIARKLIDQWRKER